MGVGTGNIQASSLELDLWIAAVGRGDRDALEKLYRATSSAVYAYALSILQNYHDAEDILHDSFVSIWRCAGDYRSQGKPMAWIMTVTRNLCLKLLQQQRRQVRLDDAMPPQVAQENPEESLMLRQCMQSLTDEERQIVVLYAVAGCKHRHIAQLMGLKLSTELSKYHRAIQKIRASF